MIYPTIIRSQSLISTPIIDTGLESTKRTITALEYLPAEQVLGHATLVRTPTQLTATVSIAEAASASMEEEHCQLLWVMVKTIGKSIRFDGKGYQYFHWKKEIPLAEHPEHRGLLHRELGHREPGQALTGALVELKELQQELQRQLEATQQQNDEVLRLLRAYIFERKPLRRLTL